MSLLLLTKSKSRHHYLKTILRGCFEGVTEFYEYMYIRTCSADKLLLHHIDTLTKMNVKVDKCDLPTFYWLPKLHKNPFESPFMSKSSHCSTTILSKHITFALTAVKYHVIKYSETAFSNSNVNYFWSIKTPLSKTMLSNTVKLHLAIVM